MTTSPTPGLVATASHTIGPFWHLIEHAEWADLTRFGLDGRPCAVESYSTAKMTRSRTNSVTDWRRN